MPTARSAFAFLLTALVATSLVATTGSPAAGKKKRQNPLAGSYSGQTTDGFPVNFRITNAGRVVGFGPAVLLGLVDFNPATDKDLSLVCPPTGKGSTCMVECPGLTTAAVSAPTLALSKPTQAFPRGKRFEYRGPGGSPPGNIASGASAPGISGSPQFGSRGFTGTLSGRVSIQSVPVNGRTCASGQQTLTPRWEARRTGR